MKKFEKAAVISVLSMGFAGGMLALEAHDEHVQTSDKRACYAQLDGKDQESCLTDVNSENSSKPLVNLGALIGFIAALGAGVETYRAMNHED